MFKKILNNISYFADREEFTSSMFLIYRKKYKEALAILNKLLLKYPFDLTLIELINTLNTNIEFYNVYMVNQIYIFYNQDTINGDKIKESCEFIRTQIFFIKKYLKVDYKKSIIIVYDPKIKYAFASTNSRIFADRIRLNPKVDFSTIVHELIHCLLPCKNRFFAEGISVIFENTFEDIKEQSLNELIFNGDILLAKKRDQILPITHLINEFDESLNYFRNDFPSNEQQFLIYLQAGSFIFYLISEFGLSKFIKFYKGISNQTDTNGIFKMIKEYYKTDLIILEKRWLLYLDKNAKKQILHSISIDEKKIKRIHKYFSKFFTYIKNPSTNFYINEKKVDLNISNLIKHYYHCNLRDLLRAIFYVEKNPDYTNPDYVRHKLPLLLYILSILDIEMQIPKQLINKKIIMEDSKIHNIRTIVLKIVEFNIEKLEKRLEYYKNNFDKEDMLLIYHSLVSLYNCYYKFGNFLDRISYYYSKFSKRVSLLELALKLDSGNKYVMINKFLNIAFTPEIMGGDPSEARQYLNQILSKFWDEPIIYYIAGLYYLKNKDIYNTNKYWNIALKMFPDNEYLKRGISLFKEELNLENENIISNYTKNIFTRSIIIKVEHLKKVYQSKESEIISLKNINFSIYENEILSIVGPNGSGKTTLIEILEGIRLPTEGRVILNQSFGIQANYDNVKYKKMINVQLQNMELISLMKVKEILNFFCKIKNQYMDNKDDAILEELITFFELHQLENNHYRNLSPGEKQKIHIVLALLGSPKIIFFDEPTNGLDPYTRNRFWEYIIRYKKTRKVTIIFTTHYLEEAEKFSDHVILLNKGEVYFDGSPAGLIHNYKNNIKIKVILKDSKNILEVIKGIDFPFSFNVEQNTVEFLVDREQLMDSFSKIGNFLKEQKIEFESLNILYPTLEEALLDLQKNTLNNAV